MFDDSRIVCDHNKALDLGRGANPKGYMVEEIWQELAKAKHLEWERSSSKRSWELQSLKYVFLVIVRPIIRGSFSNDCSSVVRILFVIT